MPRTFSTALLAVALVLAPAAPAVAAPKSTSTKLDHGTLSLTTGSQCQTGGGNCGKFFATTQYHKQKGKAVYGRVRLSLADRVYSAPEQLIKKGQKVRKTWNLSKNEAHDCRAVGYLVADGTDYYTPPLRVC